MSMTSPTTLTWCHYLQERRLQDSFIGPYHGSDFWRCQLAALGHQSSVALPSSSSPAPLIP
eukprot:6154562-Amphidinium_carterae.1